MIPPAGKTLPPYCTQLLPREGSHPKSGGRSLRRIRCGWHEFIAGNSRGNSLAAILSRFDAHDLSNAADIYIARPGNLLGKRDYEINLAADFEIRFGEKVQPAIADIPGMGIQFAALGLPRKNAHGKAHRESPRLAAFRSISHQYPLGLKVWRKTNIRPGKLQRENQ